MDKQSLQRESTPELVASLLEQLGDLVKTELSLAKAELRADVTRDVSAIAGFGAAASCGIGGLSLLLAAVVLGLATVMDAWAAALIVAVAVQAIGAMAGFIGYKRRVHNPLAKTQRTIKEDVKWTKETLS